jgi:hypothetical protein
MLEDLFKNYLTIVTLYGCNSFTLLTVFCFWLVVAYKFLKYLFSFLPNLLGIVYFFFKYTISSKDFLKTTLIKINIYLGRHANILFLTLIFRTKLKIFEIHRKFLLTNIKVKSYFVKTTSRLKLVILYAIRKFCGILRKVNPIFINFFFSSILIVLNIFRIFCDISVEVLYLYNLIKCFKDISDKCLQYLNALKKLGKKRKSSDIERNTTCAQLSTLIESNVINEKNTSEGFFLFTTKKHSITKRNNELE